MVSLEVFYYLISASKIWPDREGWSLVGMALSEEDYCNATLSLKKGGLWWEWPYQKETTVMSLCH